MSDRERPSREDADATIAFLLDMVVEWHELDQVERIRTILRRELAAAWSEGYLYARTANAPDDINVRDNPYRDRPAE